MLEQFCRVMMGFFELPRPVIAAVSGHAIAGGAILGLTADLRVFAEGSYRFALLEVPLGIPLPGFAMEMAKLAVSGSTLTELALHGRSFNPEESVKGGLGVELVGGELLVERSMERARGLAKLPGAYGSSKRRLWAEAYRRGWEAIGREGMMFLGAVDEVLSRKDAERQRGQQ
jgi:enoyl-CoA hydratase